MVGTQDLAFAILLPRSASRARACIIIFRPRPKWLPPSLDVTETASWLRSRHSRMKAPKMRSLPTGQPSEWHSTGMVGCVFAASWAPRLESYRLKSRRRYNLFFAVVSIISRVGSVGLTLWVVPFTSWLLSKAEWYSRAPTATSTLSIKQHRGLRDSRASGTLLELGQPRNRALRSIYAAALPATGQASMATLPMFRSFSRLVPSRGARGRRQDSEHEG